MTTRGDTDPRPLFTIDQRGIFAREIDAAVLRGDADLAVHSLKDVPSGITPGLVLASVPKRERANDAFIAKNGETLDSIAPGSVVGTSSLRRAVQVSAQRPDLRVQPIRGNVETRIARSGDGTCDAVVLAVAGLARLGIAGGAVPHHVLPLADFLPSPGQGSLAVVCRSGDQNTISVLESIQDPASRQEAEAERALSDAVDSGCRFPVGAHARVEGDTLTLRARAFSADGKTSVSAVRSGPRRDAARIGREAGKELQEGGVGELALNWRAKLDEWNAR